MPECIENFFSSSDIESFQNHPEVLSAKEKLFAIPTGSVSFTIPLTQTIKDSLQTSFGLDLSSVSEIPMRWIKGDTRPHIDRAGSSFQNTYLVYLNTSNGQFTIGNDTFPITENTGFTFEEGVSHATYDTGDEPRLLLGPMNEFAEPVGAYVMFYYPTQADAENDTNFLASYGGYYVVAQGGNLFWKIANSSTGPASQTFVYKAGVLIPGTEPDRYNLYPATVFELGFLAGTFFVYCLLKGTLVKVSEEEWKPIETLAPGDTVLTHTNKVSKIVKVSKDTIQWEDDQTNDNKIVFRIPSGRHGCTEHTFISFWHKILHQEGEFAGEWRTAAASRLPKAKRVELCGPDSDTYELYNLQLEDKEDTLVINGGTVVESWSGKAPRKGPVFSA